MDLLYNVVYVKMGRLFFFCKQLGGRQMPEKKLLLIINPNSGDGAARRWVYDMINILSAKYPLITVYFSKCTGDIIRAVCEYSEGYDAVVCCGGDGTLNETLNGLISIKSDAELGYIPTGTVNDFAGSHKIPKNIKMAIDKIANGEAHKYDIGRIGDRYFSYVAAFGAFTAVAYQTSQTKKASFGKIAYVAEAAKSLAELKPYKMTIKTADTEISGEFIYGMFSNSKTVGGIRFFGDNEMERLRDGMLDVTLVRYPKNAAELQSTVTALLTMGESPMVVRLKAERADLIFEEEVSFTADGEYGGSYREVSVFDVPDGINIIE